MENHHFFIGNTSTNGPFSIAMFVYWRVGEQFFQGYSPGAPGTAPARGVPGSCAGRPADSNPNESLDANPDLVCSEVRMRYLGFIMI